MAAGVPAIAFRSGGIPELIEHGVDGFLVDSTEEMAQLALELLGHSASALARVSAAARETWARRFTQARYRRDMASLLEGIAAAGHARHLIRSRSSSM